MRVISTISAVALLIGLLGAPSAASAAPGGSYRDSCRNLHVYGATLSADCRSGWGWRSSRLNYKRCYGDIANQNGALVCRGDRGQYGSYGRPDYNPNYNNDGRYDDRYGGGYDRGNADDGRYGSSYDNGYDRVGGRSGGLVLFGGGSFSGPAFQVDGEMSNLDGARFNDRAQSARIEGGVWQLCENANFGGRCITLSRSEPDLGRYGLDGAVSSVRRIR